MKLKGINPFEQHVEKIVVGAVGVGLLGVVGWQFLSQSTVTVGKDQVGIADAYKPVESAASELLRKSETSTPTLPEPVDISPLTKFPERFSTPVSTAGKLPSMGPVIALGPGGSGGAAGDAVYAAFLAPAPAKLVAAQFRGTIDPRERTDPVNKGLEAFLPKEQPLDKAAVSVEATMNGKALRTALEADPDEAGPLSPLPADWWFDKIEIVGVEVERQELKPDGSWSAATMLPTIPGRLDFLKKWNAEAKDGGAVATLVAEATTKADEIQRPVFYDMIVGKWTEPSVLAAQAAANFDANKFTTLNEEFKQKSTDLATLKADLAAMGPDEKRRPDAAPTPPPRRDGGGGGKGSSPDANRPTQPDAPREETPAAKRARLNRQIAALEARLDQIQKEVSAMGGVLSDPTLPTQNPSQPPSPTDSAGKKLFDKDDFKLYAHDITAEPGKTYRYRVRVAMNNPIFGKEILLKKNDAAQAELAAPSLAHSAWTDWTPEVSVDRDAYWFITSTNRDSLRQNIPTAHAEMYQFYYGYYRKAVTSLEPGDPIIGEAKLPKLWLAPEDSVAAGDPNVPAPVQPGGRDGGRGVAPPPAGGNQPGQAANPDVPPGPGWLPAKDKLVFRETSSVVMLDVQPIPGLERQLYAILRAQDGQVVSKSPESDAKSDLYRRVRSSADAGELASQPKIEPKANKRPENNPELPPSGPGGKGGGGGGGGG